MKNYKNAFNSLFREINKVVIGQDNVLKQVLVCVLADSNALLEGYPGLAKTLAVKTLSELMDLKFSRIQSTPDLMPSDITGTYIIEADLNVVPYSVPLFGETSAKFFIQVFDAEDETTNLQKQQKENTIDIIGLESPFYAPNTIRISAGETITFDNVDGNQHTVTSVKVGTTQSDGKFDSGLLQPDEKFELTINEKGTYHYYCALHTNRTV